MTNYLLLQQGGKRLIRLRVCLFEGVDVEAAPKEKASAGSATEKQKCYNGLIVPSKLLMTAIHKDPNLLCVLGSGFSAPPFVLSLHWSQQHRPLAANKNIRLARSKPKSWVTKEREG